MNSQFPQVGGPERDFPVGHPSSGDYDPRSPEAVAWRKAHVPSKGERDFPLGHPGAADNPSRVEPSHPLETARDFSRPETVPEAEYEGVTGTPRVDAIQILADAAAAVLRKVGGDGGDAK